MPYLLSYCSFLLPYRGDIKSNVYVQVVFICVLKMTSHQHPGFVTSHSLPPTAPSLSILSAEQKSICSENIVMSLEADNLWKLTEELTESFLFIWVTEIFSKGKYKRCG